MNQKTSTRLIGAGIIGCFCFVLGTTCLVAHSAPKMAKNILVMESCDDNPKINVLQNLKFDLPGTVGLYREIQCGKYAVQANGKLRVEFSASPLYYVDPTTKDRIALNVTYWVNEAGNSRFSFKPDGSPLTLYRNFNSQQIIEFFIYGEIVIDDLTAQPAGHYQGGVTVTAWK
ncbi:MAG TPA: hypothetical protein DDW65_19980 [Firmicutes bacterium]|nr:hypothetical protein [Bacillota bacterium]